MSRSVVILRKKALVLGISSVLAGWSGSGGLYAEELDVAPSVDVKPAAPAVMSQSNGGGGDSSDSTKPAYWPPEKQAIIIGQNPVKAINGIDIKEPGENISLEGGNLEIPTGVTIKVTGTGDGASIVGQSGTNTLTLTETGQVSVAKDATGVQLAAGSLTIDGTGSITAAKGATDTVGVSIIEGNLKNSSLISGTKAAIAIAPTEGKTATVTFNKDSVVTGLTSAPAIIASTAKGSVTLNIDGGKFTGDIQGGDATNDAINLTATTGEGIKGNISAFETIAIKGTDWTVQGWASGTTSLSTDKAISDLYINSEVPTTPVGTAEAKNTLRAAPASVGLAVTTTGDGAITNLHISGSPKLTAEAALNM